MEEILTGVFHWTTFHEGIGQRVHSYYVQSADPPFLIDPRVPEDEGIDWFASKGPPHNVFLTNRHHYRHSAEFAGKFGLEVWCHRAGLHEFTHGESVRPFEHGDELPGGVLALRVAELCPEETALLVPLHGGILSLGDAVIRDGEALSFVPDAYMGEDPSSVRQGLRRSLSRITRQHSFRHLLLAHGEPWIETGREALRAFVGRAY